MSSPGEVGPRSAGSRAAYLLAYPAGHSVSPSMHNAAFDHLGIDAKYTAWEVEPSGLPAAVDAFRRSPGFLGSNVTVPHKRAVMPLLDELTTEAKAIQAVNTIFPRHGRLVGANTDAVGFSLALAELSAEAGQRRDLVGSRALLLGAGGSARAVAWSLLTSGLQVGVHARRQEAAEELVAQLVGAASAGEAEHGGEVGAEAGAEAGADTGDEASDHPGDEGGSRHIVAVASSDVADWLASCAVLVNSTPVGMAGGPAVNGNAAPGPLRLMRPDAAVIDLVYRPAVTPLLAEAASLGLRNQNGVPMLVWQGARSFAAWTGEEPPINVMRAAAYAALERKHLSGETRRR